MIRDVLEMLILDLNVSSDSTAISGEILTITQATALSLLHDRPLLWLLLGSHRKTPSSAPMRLLWFPRQPKGCWPLLLCLQVLGVALEKTTLETLLS